MIGAVIYVRDEPWEQEDTFLLHLVHNSLAHSIRALQPIKRRLLGNVAQLGRVRTWIYAALVLAVLFLLSLPIPLSVLAPAEIVALNSEVVTAPLDGVIKQFHVQPNQSVSQGQLLFSLDDRTLRNRKAVAEQALVVARTNVLTAERKAITDPKSKAELPLLEGRVREKQAELRLIEEGLSRIDVFAAHDGVIIYSDPNDWLGKPVVTGERIARLAQPDDLGVLIWVAVADGFALEPGSAIRVFLQTDPLKPLSATLTETSYQATLSPDNIASYRVRGRLIEDHDIHIGLQGVAKILGEKRPVAYWMFRRPLGALRQMVGM